MICREEEFGRCGDRRVHGTDVDLNGRLDSSLGLSLDVDGSTTVALDEAGGVIIIY